MKSIQIDAHVSHVDALLDEDMIYSPSMIRSFQAHNIVFEGMNKLFNG